MTFRLALLVLLGTFALLFSGNLFRGEVIFPHTNALAVGLREKDASAQISNRKFSDESSFFIPELANNLDRKHRAWLNTWNPHVEGGRPAFQNSGLGRAYALTNLLTVFTRDPLMLYSTLVLLTVGLTSVFSLLFCRALELQPAAGLAAALGLGFTSALMYWLTFAIFLSTICWSVGLLWLITEFTRHKSWPLALGLAFATYSLLLTGYPQMIILFGFMLGPYTILRVARTTAVPKERLWTLLGLLGCAVIGGLAALPVYLDIASAARDSARISGVSDSFFLAVLPPHHGWSERAGFLATIFDWSWLGNAIAPDFPIAFNGLSFTPVFGSLIWLSFLQRPGRGLWFWQLFVLLCLAGTIFPSLYLFAVHHLGFGFSRIQLLCGAIVPGFVLSASLIDAVLRGSFRLTVWSTGWILLPLAGEILVALTLWHRIALSPLAIGTTLLLVLALLGTIYWRSTLGFIGLALLSVFLYGRPLILSRPPAEIHLSSALLETLKQRAGDGRFAIADRSIKDLLPPNQEALLGLQSMNSYNSLSPRRYQELVSDWSTKGVDTYGRRFQIIDPELALADPDFRLANVNVILSKRTLSSLRLRKLTEVDGIGFYGSNFAPIRLLQTDSYKFSGAETIEIDPAARGHDLPAQSLAQLDDFEKIRVTASPNETLLFVSRQYHRSWQATAKQHRLRAVLVNRFYQGVILPPMTDEVELVFRPFVRWSWVPQVFFAVGAALVLVRLLRQLGGAKKALPG